ncbi:MerR family transcriptional regulator [Actinokineospora bangkokensis]|uniref:MerR family transcriptional regulator n=1 Tax=Actinokineospora bangkokensis TaxID=1193682 RepID=A0A1Q9LEN3_9PSEU|nr:MerR family transcriptional regulator [Actinokineospora bangkokensis]OLR90496.1 MerR family transcriptional regulator [Actinokineospora bangkokensis]
MTYAIAEAAHRTGLSIDTLRYYERIELIDPPARDSGGRRAYTDSDLDWLTFLTRLRTTGMPIRLMREYARLRHQGPASAVPRKRILERHRADVLARVAELRSCLEVLDYKIDNYERMAACEAGAPAAAVPELREATA